MCDESETASLKLKIFEADAADEAANHAAIYLKELEVAKKTKAPEPPLQEAPLQEVTLTEQFNNCSAQAAAAFEANLAAFSAFLNIGDLHPVSKRSSQVSMF